MHASHIIERVLTTDLLHPQLVVIAEDGASDSDLDTAEAQMNCRFSHAFRLLLKKWNGINLDVIRIYGVGNVSAGISPIHMNQVLLNPEFPSGSYVIGSDPAGFIYVETPDGKIYTLDHDGGDVEQVAESFDDLFVNVIFGPKAENHFGTDWLTELRERHIIDA